MHLEPTRWIYFSWKRLQRGGNDLAEILRRTFHRSANAAVDRTYHTDGFGAKDAEVAQRGEINITFKLNKWKILQQDFFSFQPYFYRRICTAWNIEWWKNFGAWDVCGLLDRVVEDRSWTHKNYRNDSAVKHPPGMKPLYSRIISHLIPAIIKDGECDGQIRILVWCLAGMVAGPHEEGPYFYWAAYFIPLDGAKSKNTESYNFFKSTWKYNGTKESMY